MLTKDQTKKLEEKLLAEKTNLEEQLAQIGGGLDFGSDVDHFEEESDEAEEFSNRLDVKRVLKRRLSNTNKALDKMKQGRYGICENCGGEIDYAVLEAAPESSLCRQCKMKK